MQTPELLSDPVFHDEDAARAYIEEVRWPDFVVCPLCGSFDKISQLAGESMGPGWWYCGACQDKFTFRMGTVMERRHIPASQMVARLPADGVEQERRLGAPAPPHARDHLQERMVSWAPHPRSDERNRPVAARRRGQDGRGRRDLLWPQRGRGGTASAEMDFSNGTGWQREPRPPAPAAKRFRRDARRARRQSPLGQGRELTAKTLYSTRS